MQNGVLHVNVYLLDTRMKGIRIMRNNLSNKQHFWLTECDFGESIFFSLTL